MKSAFFIMKSALDIDRCIFIGQSRWHISSPSIFGNIICPPIFWDCFSANRTKSVATPALGNES